ncbi:AAA family ATPase [Serratia marcescens]|uniref:AAA family ATPase n=1 Tax=Serratia marcescens TaxID=615 RepID=UPI00275DCAEC|nr:AAA family ATPase [Serratia marcescens]MDP8631225.1 AAA family ATPase [Serratia marcescens]MDP8764362.1 AAA family ATPase [Serratia marcescens]
MYQRERLFSRLGHFAYQSFVEATKLCRTFRHEYVELEHWLKVLVDKERGDLPLILAHYAINIQRVSDALDRILHTLPNRTNAVVDLSTQLETVVERGLLMSQLAETPSGGVRTIHILVGILQDPTLQRSLYRLSEEFKKLPIPQLFDDYPVILAESVEHEEEEEESYGALGEAPDAPETVEILDKWCADLTRQARDGEIDPVIGREAELRQVIDILLRRRQNNPILVGEAGVGKTAVAEALACKIAQGQVPPLLQGARLLSLDLGRMQAGASMRGEFESRLKALIDAIAHSAVPVILFCDEAHTLVGAGGQAGTGDAVNLLKPMLARGALRMVAATTWSEYKQFIEPDAALTRRFQYVLVSEPDEENAVNMMRAIAPHFAQHHSVKIRESALQAAVHLSLRHLPSRQLPDIHEAFYQVFDKGVMEDGEGRMISFRQCFILMTSNIGAGEIEATLAETPDLKTEALRPMLHDVLARFFPAALLARMNVIPYVPLSTEAITHIATKQISRLQQRLRKEVGVSLVLEGDIPGWIAKRISAHPSRGRAVESLLQQAILPPISNEVLQRKRTGQELQNIQLMVENDSLSVYFD